MLNGPTATGQHCIEGWTLYQTPGPRMKGVEGTANADYHYYNWVDQFDALGLGENVPIATGTTSDALLALRPETGEWVTMRVPYPLGFYSRGLDGRIDDPGAGWKGRGALGQLQHRLDLPSRGRQGGHERDRPGSRSGRTRWRSDGCLRRSLLVGRRQDAAPQRDTAQIVYLIQNAA